MRASPQPHRQAGVSLIYALLALVAMSLAAVALVRSVDSGNLVIGNLGFKQDATTAADTAAEQAMTWLGTQTAASLAADMANVGYYAASLEALDATGSNPTAVTRIVVDWEGDACASVDGNVTRCVQPSAEIDLNGTRARYIVARICSDVGPTTSAGITCPTPLSASSSEDTNRSGVDYSRTGGFGTSTAGPYYRIVVRATGARGTRSFTETIVHF